MQTARLLLEPLSRTDIELFHATNIDPFVRRHLWDDEIISRDMSLDVLEGVEQHFREDNWGLWKLLLSETRTFVGYAGLWTFFSEPQPQLLYALLEQHTGRGYATEAAQLITEYALTTLDYDYLIASMNRGNNASVAVCERVGFKFVEERAMEGQATLFYRVERPH